MRGIDRRYRFPKAIDSAQAGSIPAGSSHPSDDEARAFLQERLAYLGRVYASIGLGFYLTGNLVSLVYPQDLSRRITELSFWVVPAASSVYLLQWIICRKGPLPQLTLRIVDGATTILAALFHSTMVFTAIPG